MSPAFKLCSIIPGRGRPTKEAAARLAADRTETSIDQRRDAALNILHPAT